jgi:hypothetical protein
MVAGNDLGEVGIDTKTKGKFRVVFQSLIATGSFNVGTLLRVDLGFCARILPSAHDRKWHFV